MRFPVSTDPVKRRRCSLNQSFSVALFGQCKLNVFVRKDGANFDVSAKGTDVIPQRSEFYFGALFKPGYFALFDLHRERKSSLGHLAIFAQFIERHAFKNGVGALLGASATGLGHQLVSDAVVREGSACHNVLSRLPIAGGNLRSLPERVQVQAVQFIRLLDELLVKAAPPMFVATDEQDGRSFGIEGKKCAERQMLVMRGAQFLHVGKCRSFDGIDIRPSENRPLFPEKMYGYVERFPLFPREGLHPIPKLRRRADFVSHVDSMRCTSYDVKLIFLVEAKELNQGAAR